MNETEPRQQSLDTIIIWLDRIVKPLAVLSVGVYLLEIEFSLRNKWDNSYESPTVFLWIERIVASFFTVEFLVRCKRAARRTGEEFRTYPLNAWGLIDLLCVAPFWIGFFAPVSYLGIVRTLRILRLLKFFRYSRTLQLTALKFYRAWHNLKGVMFSLCVFWLFFALVLLNLEHAEQPEKFGGIIDAIWFTVVTATTVGYGDAFPVGVWGKLFVGVMLVPIISVMGMAFSAFATACESVQELEDCPEVDPIEEWKKERNRIRQLKEADRDYRMDE